MTDITSPHVYYAKFLFLKSYADSRLSIHIVNFTIFQQDCCNIVVVYSSPI